MGSFVFFGHKIFFKDILRLLIGFGLAFSTVSTYAVTFPAPSTVTAGTPYMVPGANITGALSTGASVPGSIINSPLTNANATVDAGQVTGSNQITWIYRNSYPSSAGDCSAQYASMCDNTTQNLGTGGSCQPSWSTHYQNYMFDGGGNQWDVLLTWTGIYSAGNVVTIEQGERGNGGSHQNCTGPLTITQAMLGRVVYIQCCPTSKPGCGSSNEDLADGTSGNNSADNIGSPSSARGGTILTSFTGIPGC
jgi:hypothetical protein